MSSSGSPDNPFAQWVDLAQPRLGSRVVYATDDFFADKARLIAPAAPIFIADKFDDNGKWMDGWESRRKRGGGYDYCIVRLGVPGRIRGVDIDTSHFTGNFPPAASLDACVSRDDVPGSDTDWQEIVQNVTLAGNSHCYEPVASDTEYTHVRLNIYPDGGVARLRIHGEIRPDWQSFSGAEPIDLLALEHGGRALICNDEHFGSMRNLNAPGRGVNMGDGWETARRRVPGNDWVILALGCAGRVEMVEIDTAHFKGNYPEKTSIQAAHTSATDPDEIAAQSVHWATLLPPVPLAMDRQHQFRDELLTRDAITHVRINIFPDGGLSRVRLIGYPADKENRRASS